MLSYGDVVLAAGGIYSTKPRPVLIIQNEKCYTGESVLVIPFTSKENAEIETRVPVSPTAQNGLDKGCFLEVDKLSAIRSNSISEKIGVIEEEYIEQAKKQLITLLLL